MYICKLNPRPRWWQHFLRLALGLVWLGGAALGQDFPFVQRTFQSEEGLPSNNVRTVAVDTHGLLWVGTDAGVVRFDGMKFRPFTKEKEVLLSRKSVWRLYPLANGEVWVGLLGGGVLRWDGAKLTEIMPDEAEFAPKNQILQEESGRVLLSVFTGRERGIFYAWTATGGVQRVEAESIDQGVFEKDRAAWRRKGRSMRLGDVHELYDAEGRLWITSRTLRLQMQEGTKAPLEVPLIGLDAGYQVWELAADREGTVWVATDANGLVQFIPKRVQVQTPALGFSETAFNSVWASRDGTVLAAPKTGGLEFHRQGSVRTEEIDPRVQRRFSGLHMIFEDRDERLWAASRFGYLHFYEHGVWNRLAGPVRGNLRGVRAMTQDENGRLWFGVSTMIFTKVADEWKIYAEAEGVPKKDITTLAAGPGGAIWAGNSVGDVLRLHGDTFSIDTHTSNAPGRGISMILCEADGGVWATTLGAGLLYREPSGRWHTLDAKHGLPESRLTGVVRDAQGYLWLGSLAGILRVNSAEIRQTVAAGTGEIHWNHLDHMDGMLSRECSSGSSPTVSTGADGSVYFATAEGVAQILPSQWKTKETELKVLFSEVKVDGETLSTATGPLIIGPGPVRLEVGFFAPSMRSGSKVRYRYQLQGFEETLNNVSGEPMVLFPALPPGDYVLQVYAATGDGVWGSKPASLAISVLAPFWQHWWFRISAVGVFAGAASLVGWMLARRRLRQRLAEIRLQAAREAERSRIARDLHDDLGASLTEITLLAGLGADASQTPEAAKEILESLETKTRTAVGTLDEIVWAVNPRHDTLASFAEYLAAFSVDLTEAASKRLRLAIADDLPKISLRSEERHHLFLACREALNNAIKHSEGTEINVLVAFTQDRLLVEISDNGRGFDAQDFSLSEGLKNLDARLKELKGDCKISSTRGTGTKVSLTLPIQSTTEPTTSEI